MTLRLTPTEDETLARLAKAFNTSKNLAAATAIDLAAPKQDNTEFVRKTTERLLGRYMDLMARLTQA